MTTRLTPEQEAAIEEFLKNRHHIARPESVLRVAYPAHVSALLAEIDALREELDDTKMALGLERADNAFKTALWETAIKDAARLRKERDDAKAGLAWSDELPTKPGFYWWRSQDASDPAWIVFFESAERVFAAGGARAAHVEKLPGRWAGPLMPPQEP